MAEPRHRRELPHERPVLRYEPQISLRSSDFDAVSPIRRPVEPKPQTRSLETSDALHLAHS